MAQYCGCVEPDCSVCYSLTADYCPDTINIPCGLTPLTQYYVWVEDRFGNLFYDLITSDANGDVDIVCSNFPDIFKSDSGVMTVFVTVNDTPDNLLTLNFPTPTNCVALSVSPPIYLTDKCGNFLTDQDGNYILVS